MCSSATSLFNLGQSNGSMGWAEVQGAFKAFQRQVARALSTTNTESDQTLSDSSKKEA